VEQQLRLVVDRINSSGEPPRLCRGPKCSPRKTLSNGQRRYHCKQCRLDARNARRDTSASGRAKNAAAVRCHRERMRSIDPLRRYFSDAARQIVRAYASAGRRLRRDTVMNILRTAEEEQSDLASVRRIVRALVRQARRAEHRTNRAALEKIRRDIGRISTAKKRL
jgi:hypothetical protein